MSTQQTILVLVALIILGSVTISADNVILNQSNIGYNTEAIITGTALAQAEIEQITVKYFDGNLPPPKSTSDSTDFTAPNSLGPNESGVTKGNPLTYKDIDDYSGYQYADSTVRLGVFTIKDTVYYVTDSNPDQNALTQTFIKRIDVTISNPYINTKTNSITLSKLVSYRFKN